MEILGWIGSIMLAVCGLPQALLSYRTKSSAGVSWGLLVLWFVGEWFVLIYTLATVRSAPLVVNYVLNILFLLVIIYYKINGRTSNV